MTEAQLNKERTKIAKRLKTARQGLGMSQKEVAEVCGLTVGTINRMENGKFWLVMRQYVLICQCLGIDYLK